jgi:hypothetical protein
MTNAGTATAASIRDHADRIEEPRFRLEGVRFTSALIDRDRPLAGSVSSWVNECLERPVQRQDGIVEYLTGNLEIAARKLRATANAFEGLPGAPALERVTAVSYWASNGQTAPKIDFGAKARQAAAIERLAKTMAVQSWAEGALAEPRAIMPPGPGIPFDFAPLRDIETMLYYRSETAAAQVRAWADMSDELQRIAQELEGHLEHDMPEWTGEAHAAYCWLMDHNVNSATNLSATAAAIASAIQGVGIVVDSTLASIRERTGRLGGQLMSWAGGEDVQGASGQQLAEAMTQWALAVIRDLTALAQSLGNLKSRLTVS